MLNPGPAAGQRSVVEDGDPNGPAEPSAPIDGVLDTPEPTAPEDGADTSVVDTRDQDDAALFQNSAPTPDPLLYQIEDLDPIVDNRLTSRFFRQEPYDPVGIQIGSFVLFPELELGSSYYSNVFHAPNALSDVTLDVVPAARLVSNWSRHALEFSATGGLSFYNQYPTEDDRDYLLEARGRLDITRRANIQALLSRTQAFEDRSALDASSVGTRAKILTDRAEASYNQRFNRLSMQFRGSVTDYAYGNTEDAGVVTNNQDRDYTQYEEAARATWEFKPTFSPFVEVAVNHRDYAEAAQSDGINRTSNGQRYRFGVSFGNTGRNSARRSQPRLRYPNPRKCAAAPGRWSDHRCQRDVARDRPDIGHFQRQFRCIGDNDDGCRRRSLPLRRRRGAPRVDELSRCLCGVDLFKPELAGWRHLRQ